ncbi:MAG: hypothetical protein FD133_485 [Erysipelotrichaceae bacterium]|nr:MAG: hypothetical protein FD179_1424 [Erysipelotrichaceae bacterium]TXT19125.1 MAG: hypothetical protein FD133_485 [Erysipelotrichaceae bacterium]
MERDLRRVGIYPYKVGKSVYYDKLTKVTYLVPKDDLKNFELMSSRFVLGIMAAIIFFYAVMPNYLYSGILGITVYVVLEIYFRFVMLKKYEIIKNPNINNLYNRRKTMEKQAPRILMIKAMGYFVSSIGIVAFLMIYKYPIEQVIAIIVVVLYAIYNGLMNLSVYLKLKNTK